MPETVRTLLPLMLPIAIIELALMVVALYDVINRPRVRYDNKLVWILIIVLINIIGPLVYLIFGREEE